MSRKLTDRLVKELPTPEKGNRITYDAEVKGFGVRVTAGGARAFILNYRVGGRERRYTIGSYPDWTVAAAREEAKGLKRRIDRGEDPMGERHDERQAPAMVDLWARYAEEHLPRKRSRRDDESVWKCWIKPALGSRKVADVRHADIDSLHRKVTRHGAPSRANRTVATLSKMFNLSIRWGWRSDNPAKGVERNPENKRERYLTPEEIRRLSDALAAHPNQQSANLIRLLMLTGARRGETLKATWEQFDLKNGVWWKPASSTKQAKPHRIPLSAPAQQLLAQMKSKADPDCPYVFPGKRGPKGRITAAQTDLKHAWATIRRHATVIQMAEHPDERIRTLVAELVKKLRRQPTYRELSAAAREKALDLPTGLMDVRLHDLRHSFASILASAGASLPLIGRLLGHSTPATTARYAHLFDDPLREAAERVGAIVTGGASAEVVPIRKGGAT